MRAILHILPVKRSLFICFSGNCCSWARSIDMKNLSQISEVILQPAATMTLMLLVRFSNHFSTILRTCHLHYGQFRKPCFIYVKPPRKRLPTCLSKMVLRHFRSFSKSNYFGSTSKSFAQQVIFLFNPYKTRINPSMPVYHKIL